MKIRLSKTQWKQIGKIAGWIKTAKDIHDILINFDTMELLENEKHANPNEDVWSISYDSQSLNDPEIADALIKTWGASSVHFHSHYLQACGFRGINLKTKQPVSGEDIANKTYYDQESFWNLIKENESVYAAERSIEKQEMQMGDDQALGHYDLYGPDDQKPQY